MVGFRGASLSSPIVSGRWELIDEASGDLGSRFLYSHSRAMVWRNYVGASQSGWCRAFFILSRHSIVAEDRTVKTAP